MKKLIFITLLISISTVLSFAQEAKKTNSEVTGSQTNEKQKQWLPSNFRAISEVSVTLFTPAGEKVQSVATDHKGEFNFTSVAAGKYVVAIGNYDVKSFKTLSHVIISPRDPATGLPTGKRMHKPFVITKEFDKGMPTRSKTSAGANTVAIPAEKSAAIKDDICDDDCDGFVEITLGFGEKVNAGLHVAGSALAQGASLLGGSLPGGAVISSALNIQQGIEIQEPGIIGGTVMKAQKVKTKSNQANDKQSQGATFGEKTKHDTVKNSVGNIR